MKLNWNLLEGWGCVKQKTFRWGGGGSMDVFWNCTFMTHVEFTFQNNGTTFKFGRHVLDTNQFNLVFRDVCRFLILSFCP